MRLEEYLKEDTFKETKIKKIRYESFGGIISLEDPPALVYVDRDFMLDLGYRPSRLWEEGPKRYLSAPTEVHFSVTNLCPLRCPHCYMDSGRRGKELDTSTCKEILKILAKKGVFHIAFGGGEAFERKDLFELAAYCRELDMVPNVTTNGYYITKDIAKRCNIFGRINVSLDGLQKEYQEIRGVDGFKIADQAIRNLVEVGNHVGINCVVSSKNFHHLLEIVGYGEERGVESILFLRFKPRGRGKSLYHEMKLTPEQNKELFPVLTELQRKTEIILEVDCSFVPMVCYHRPSTEVLQFWGVEGCPAASLLLGIFPNGEFNACSLSEEIGGDTFQLPQQWKGPNIHLEKFRNWTLKAKPPCNSCSYLEICQGGCHIVAEYVTGDFYHPDPECPRVEADNGKPGDVVELAN